MQTPLIDLQDIRKAYGGGDAPEVHVLRGIDLSVSYTHLTLPTICSV